jgi:hypothetical protein
MRVISHGNLKTFFEKLLLGSNDSKLLNDNSKGTDLYIGRIYKKSQVYVRTMTMMLVPCVLWFVMRIGLSSAKLVIPFIIQRCTPGFKRVTIQLEK